MKKFLKIFTPLVFLGSAVGAGYYFLVMRTKGPQVELYFDDGSMLAMQGKEAEAAPFVDAAQTILALNAAAV